MKKRLFGLVAMMLAAMIVVLAFPVQVKAAGYRDHYSFSQGDIIEAGDIVVASGGTFSVYINNKLCAKNVGTYEAEKKLIFKGKADVTASGGDAVFNLYFVADGYTEVSAPKITPEQQAILKYNDAWDKIQKEYADETQMPVEPFMSAQAIASVPETVKNNSTAIANLKSLKTVPGVMALINKAQKVTAGDKVTIYTEKPMTFSKEGFEAISNQNKTVVYAFKIDGVLYQITIPAGAKVDFGDNTYVGPLWIGAQLGTTVVVQ